MCDEEKETISIVGNSGQNISKYTLTSTGLARNICMCGGRHIAVHLSPSPAVRFVFFLLRLVFFFF